MARARNNERRRLQEFVDAGEGRCWRAFCGRPATVWDMPDGGVSLYCADHGPVAVELNRRVKAARGRADGRP